MASTTVRRTALPAWALWLRNWLIDGQYAGLEWFSDAPEPSVRYRLHERIESLGESLLYAIFRSEPISETDLVAVNTLLAVAEFRGESPSPTRHVPIH